jgi:hypothetical protein
MNVEGSKTYSRRMLVIPVVTLDLASTYKKLCPLPRFSVQLRRDELCRGSGGKDIVGGPIRGNSESMKRGVKTEVRWKK